MTFIIFFCRSIGNVNDNHRTADEDDDANANETVFQRGKKATLI